jgi:hypothetical protein
MGCRRTQGNSFRGFRNDFEKRVNIYDLLNETNKENRKESVRKRIPRFRLS